MAAERQLTPAQLDLGQIGVVGHDIGRRRQDRERLPGLVALALDELGAARQSIDFLAHAIGLRCEVAADRDFAFERSQGDFLAH